MNTLIDVPAGTEPVRAGLNFTRVNAHGGIAVDEDRCLRLLVDGRYIADVWEAVPGSWSTSGVGGYQTGFGALVHAEDAVIAAYHQLSVRADYEIDVLHAEVWHTVIVGRVDVDADRLSALGARAREIAVEYQSLRNAPVRVTLWSTTAPTSRVTTYAEYRLEEPMTEQPGQPGQPDPLTADPLTPFADAVKSVNLDWSTLGQGDRVWRVNPATGQPQGLTIDAVNEDTVTGHLDVDGPTVTLPLTDIRGQVLLLEDEVTKVLGAGGKAEWMQRIIERFVADPSILVWVPDLGNGRSQTEAWMADRTPENEAAMRRALAGPDEVVIGQTLHGVPVTWRPAYGQVVAIEHTIGQASHALRAGDLVQAAQLLNAAGRAVRAAAPDAGVGWPPNQRDGSRGDDFPWPDPDARPRS